MSYRLVLAGFAAVALLGIFWLPYHVPLQPSLSDSYIFHFNNRACWLALLVTAIVLVAFGPQVDQLTMPGKPLSPRTLSKALTGTFVVSTGLYLLTRRLNGFDESLYLIDRLRLLMEGRLPYRDFEYAYGAAFLYGPALLARVLHLGAADAYGLFLLASYLLGTYLLYVCICWLDGPPAAKRSVFLLFWALSLLNMLNLGVNYSLLRYVLPLFCILQEYRLAARSPQDAFAAGPFAWAAGAYLILLLESTELALAFAFASVLYLCLAGRLRVPGNAMAFVAMILFFGGLTWVAERGGVLDTLHAFRSGGANLPVMPAPHILLLLAAVALMACRTGTLLRSHIVSPTVPVFALVLAELGAALGRCDPSHVLMNGLALFLVTGLVTRPAHLPWRSFIPLFWLVFGILPLALGAKYYLSQLGKAALPTLLSLENGSGMTRVDKFVLRHMQASLGPELGTEKFAEYRAAAHRPKDFNLDRIFNQASGTIYEAPYGFSITHFGLYHSRNVDQGFFYEMINVSTAAQVRRKLNELTAHPERPLLLLPGRENSCYASGPEERVALSHLFLYPYRARAISGPSLSAPFCDYIRAHYRITEPADAAHFGYALWTPAH